MQVQCRLEIHEWHSNAFPVEKKTCTRSNSHHTSQNEKYVQLLATVNSQIFSFVNRDHCEHICQCFVFARKRGFRRRGLL